MNTLTPRAQSVAEYVIQQRRWFHRNPELSKVEFKTTEHIVEELSQIDIPIQRFDGLTGCVGTLKGGKPGKTVMLRADIDALPIQEINRGENVSQNKGVMHACGHDCHMAMLLGAAKILKACQAELPGTVKFLFQMGEEIGVESRKYIKVGALNDVDALFGMHVWSQLDAGTANFEMGERMASSDRFEITVSGKDAYGTQPQKGCDAILAASAVISALQAITSKMNAPDNTLVVTVGMLNGGENADFICDEVKLVGTVRTFDKKFRKEIPAKMDRIISHVACAYGCKSVLNYEFLPSPVINEHRNLVDSAQQAVRNQLGPNALAPMTKVMGAEDFAEFMEKVPAVFGFLGVRNRAKGIVCSQHHPAFRVDEDVLPAGAAIYSYFARLFLNSKI